MNRITLYTFLLIIGISVRTLVAQPGNIAFRNLTPAEGLPITTVTDVTQDAFGFIWIGSWDGVFRYDGYNFYYISSNGRYLTADQKGGVWISLEGGDLAYFDSYSDKLKTYIVPHAKRFTGVTVDIEGSVWASSNQGVLKLNNELDSFLIDSNQEKGGIYHMSSQGGQLLFICLLENQKGKIGQRSKKGVYSYIDLPLDINNPVEQEFFTSQYSFYITSYGSEGIFILNRFGWAIKEKGKDWYFKSADKKDALSENSGRIIDGDGNLWLNQQDAITKIDISGGSSTIYKHNPTDPNSILPMESVFAGSDIFIDRQGILWITRFSHGISRLNLYESDFGLVRDDEGKKIVDVLSVIELDDGSLFIGSRIDNEGLFYLDSERKLKGRYGAGSFGSPLGKSTSNELSHPFPWSLAQSSDGSIWVGTGSPGPNNGGLNRIRLNSDLITRFKFDPEDESSISGNWIGKILVDSSDRVWFNGGSGICSIDAKTEKITRGLENPPIFSYSDSINIESYYPELINAEGNLIVRSNISQMHYSINYETQQILPFGKPLKEQERFNYVHQDNKGHIWFIGAKQFGYLDLANKIAEQTFDYNTDKFPAREINALYSDHNRKIWLATDIGIFHFDPESHEYKHYTYNRGLQGNYYRQNVNHKGPSGKIYFGGNGGLNIIDPDKIKSNPYPPDMVFTGLKIDGSVIVPDLDSPINKPLNVADEMVVQPYTSVINITFAAIHFAGFNDNKYQYKLDGFDEIWQDGGNLGSATYTSLAPGKYAFRIKGSNWDGIWSNGNKSIRIHILPPWWMTTFAYIVYFFLLIGIVYTAHKIQSRRVIAREREKAREKELAQAREIEIAYTELKATQKQLIQSEKMASLGELTAGIAHEIQNPLNFVNNFSEVNRELIEELKAERLKLKLKRDEKLEEEIINDLENNTERINHHGKRADSIVKGMLQHSRTSTGEKELTDINALCDEYLRLAYHGLRAKDKSFNADFRTELDPDLPKINIIPQDIGRVLLNLINNAFQAVAEVGKPEVIVSTKKHDNEIVISVADNGPGIPEDIKDKIFQPFFTTKPTGQGTGLGLSLSYDIVKAHGGSITVSSAENVGTEFILKLLIQ